MALSAGDPVEARTASWLRPHATLPGCFEGPPEATFLLVVISALPRTRHTLLVRSMGAGSTLREAWAELAALPADAPERQAATPHLVTLRMALHQDPSDDAKDARMDAEKIFNELMAQSANLGRLEGRLEGRQEGRQEGLALLRRQCARRMGRALTASEEAAIGARLDQVGPERLGDVVLDLSGEALAAWLADPDAR